MPPLTTGSRLGPYEIAAQIGAGGMGVVYRARDSKLNRDVALKILLPAVANDPDRLARFAREAQVLAALNHTNIAQVHGFEESGEVSALVMELVEGPTLSELIAAHKPTGMPLDEIIAIARQVAEALDAAHEQGIVHRDLKPANIKVRSDGTVKVLDFGLAKAFTTAPDRGQNAAMSPTISIHATQAGLILGTAAYMSPEQARGRPVDKRADIWAFGCVLYEMLSGQMAFDAEDVSLTLSKVLQREPDWSVLSSRPASIRQLVRRCLEKEPKRRLRDIGDARIDLEGVEHAASPEIPGRSLSTGRGWIVAAVLSTIAALALAALVVWQRPASPELTKLQLLPPPQLRFGAMAPSPDGRRIAFTATDTTGISKLWVRTLESTEPQSLPDTDYASYPFWSPDGRYIGFFAGGKLKKIDTTGGSPQTVCTLMNRGEASGGAWNIDNTIIFGFNPYSPRPLYQVAAAGGDPREVTKLGESEGHYWPTLLRDGRHFVYFASSPRAERQGLYVASLDGGEARRLVATDGSGVFARRPASAGAGPDYLLFVRERAVVAQAFDATGLSLVGEAVQVGGPTSIDGSMRSALSVSDAGTLILEPEGSNGPSQLTWFDRTGQRLGELGPPGLNIDVRISPAGDRVAVQREDGHGGADIWHVDRSRGILERLTTHPSYDAAPVWSSDGQRITFFSTRDGSWNLYERSTSGASDSLLLKTANLKVPDDWSPDGRFLLFQEIDPQTSTANRGDDLWLLPSPTRSGEAVPKPWLRTEFDEYWGRFSPDGKWVAYQSTESGRMQIHIASIDASGSAAGRRQISMNGGVETRWPRSGREIFYVGPDNMLTAVEVKLGASLDLGVPRPLFQIRASGIGRYDVTPDGQQILVSVPLNEAALPATIVQNWFEELRRLAPASRN